MLQITPPTHTLFPSFWYRILPCSPRQVWNSPWVQVSLELLIVLPQPPKCWFYRHVPLFWAHTSIHFQEKFPKFWFLLVSLGYLVNPVLEGLTSVLSDWQVFWQRHIFTVFPNIPHKEHIFPNSATICWMEKIVWKLVLLKCLFYNNILLYYILYNIYNYIIVFF